MFGLLQGHQRYFGDRVFVRKICVQISFERGIGLESPFSVLTMKDQQSGVAWSSRELLPYHD